ncbi:unnamed protein product [Spirodela intermedia]|uniref:Uncharacterized protein n=2 Tax=Spirodela intermedia TaxID=51605 RepID=A0A7I8KB46_SPIIN|nr:unnamed protein product [Spirodela intermedia]CAA6658625.1 unnamed protein product [Spirodela intermedia]CAA7394901.1 unnamed protein product [Spirodela intermedia]
MGSLGITHSGAMYPCVPFTPEQLKRSSLVSFAMPKSETLGQKSPSRRMFSGLMSLCSTHSRHSSWR